MKMNEILRTMVERVNKNVLLFPPARTGEKKGIIMIIIMTSKEIIAQVLFEQTHISLRALTVYFGELFRKKIHACLFGSFFKGKESTCALG